LKKQNIQDITPYDKPDDKKGQVRTMFDRIAPYYDFLNHFLSLGIDIAWRKKAIQELVEFAPNKILDVATGTGDLAFEACKKLPNASITAIDLSPQMLEIAVKKQASQGRKEVQSINFLVGDSEHLPFADGHFDSVMAAFGVRNFESLESGLKEMHRVTRLGGQIVVLEFSKPKRFPFKQLYNTYFKYVLPTIGRLTSKDPKAYRYLYESVQAFPDYEKFTSVLEKIGYKECKITPLTLGICCIYTAVKA